METSSLADLLDVQELDLQIDRLLERRESLPELEALKKAHARREELETQLKQANASLKQLELDLDKSEGELGILEEKLHEHETRLFSGGMSARETEFMRLEVQNLKERQGTLEEKVLTLLEEVDPAREAVSSLEAQAATVAKEKAELEASIKAQWGKIDAELARKEDRKKEAADPISPDLMELYEKLRGLKEGVAIAPYEHRVCGGCRLALSPAEEKEAFSAEIPRCVHCRRILVA